MADPPPPAPVESSNYVGWRRQSGWHPLTIVRADGSTFWDDRGRPYLDFASQLAAVNLGYGNAAVSGAIAEQSARLPYISPNFSTETRARLSVQLTRHLPSGLGRFFFGSTGTEANESALLIARAVTGKTKVLSRPRSYHGATSAALSVSGDLRRRPVERLQNVPGTLFAPDCYCYRCPLGLRYPSCGVACATEVETLLTREPDTAAMIVEPVVGTNGVIVPVPEYLPMIRETTRRHGVLLIADEVMTGWGRTGAWFAVDHWNVKPDLLTTAKGLTSAYVPLALTATTEAVRSVFEDRFFPQGHTYEAHPTALAAASASIAEYERLALVERSRREGEYLLQQVREVGRHHASVGDVRGLGLFVAIELVRDPETKSPFNSPEEKLAGRPLVADRVAAALMEEGVYVMSWVSHLVLAPPLIVSREEIDRAVSALDRALRVADEAMRPSPPPPPQLS